MTQPIPFFSLVVPTYNRANLLVPTLQSLLNQDYDRYEILVVDDGSTDNTEAVVQPLLCSKLRYYKKENGERAAARTSGARL
ncbi:MAG: glycosyltransferase family A protein, partial [Sphingobacteriia bacterium]